ncbi:MAG: hypothetical protein ACE5ET_11425 [Gammaproteobacteria bacterium]
MHHGWEKDASELLIRLEQHWREQYTVHELQRRIVAALQSIKQALTRDSADARLILDAYRHLLHHEARQEELAQANEALRRLLKSLGLAVVVLLPMSFITLPALFALAHRLGIGLLPAAETAGNDKTPETHHQSRKQ